MLTNFYYYNYYKPYIFKTKPVISASASQNKVQDVYKSDSSQQEKNFLLNSAYKSEIINYAKNVSEKMNGFKDSVHELLRNSGGSYYLPDDPHDEDGQTSKDEIIYNLKRFTDMANETISFTAAQRHSSILSQFGEYVGGFAEFNSDAMSVLDITVDDNGLTFNHEKAEKKSLEDLKRTVSGLDYLFSELYEQAKEVMSRPLTEHMKFKSLGYYYNYKYGSVFDNAYNIIETGILYDKAI